MQWTASFICGYQSQLFGIAILRMATCAFFEVADKEMYFDPNWDNRYGFYWENGWFYVYRSGVLLLRFQLKPMPDGTYRICHLQKTEAPQAMVGALSEALFSLKWK